MPRRGPRFRSRGAAWRSVVSRRTSRELGICAVYTITAGRPGADVVGARSGGPRSQGRRLRVAGGAGSANSVIRANVQPTGPIAVLSTPNAAPVTLQAAPGPAPRGAGPGALPKTGAASRLSLDALEYDDRGETRFAGTCAGWQFGEGLFRSPADRRRDRRARWALDA